MSGRVTRGHQDLNGLRELVGSSKPLPQTDLPSLRDLLRAGIYIKERDPGRGHDVSDLGIELADLLVAVYTKANIQFVPGQNLYPTKTIKNKIIKEWNSASSVGSGKSKGFKSKKEILVSKLDKLYNVMYCQCTNITSCEEKGCDTECKKLAHIECSCLKEQKIPVIELLFVRDQRNRNSKGLVIGTTKDVKESKRLEKQFKRKADDEESQRKLKEIEEEEEANKSARVSDSELIDYIGDIMNVPDDEDNERDLEFTANLKKKSAQNRINLDNLARESLRGGVSVRNTALLATALLVDLKLVTKEEAHLIVDPSKIQRAREKVMKEERLEAKKDLEEVKVVAVFIDGRRDKTKAIVVDEDGDEFARTIIEEHITVTDPNRYLTHVTPAEGSGAKGEADKVIEFLTEVKQLENVKVIGGDSTNSNTGWKDGAIHHIEVGKKEKVVWDICLLHTQELGLRHLMKSRGMETSGVNCYSGELGPLIKDDVHEYEVNDKFEKLDFAIDLREVPKEIVEDLSTDQKYMYKITKMIITGELDYDVMKQVIGPLNHSRWLTTACRLCRLWISKHGLRRNTKTFQSLKIIVSYIVSVYVPSWFEVKCKPNIIHGPDHMLNSVMLVERYCTAEVKAVVQPVMQRGAWHAHSENMLLAMIGSEDQSRRQFAIDKIRQIRGSQDQGNSAVRAFHVPQINFQAGSLFNLIDWSKAELMEPVLTCSVPTGELDQYIEQPFPRLSIDCHTQACERAVKETTIAASKVIGFERRDGLIRAKLKSRKLVSSITSKKTLAGMLG